MQRRMQGRIESRVRKQDPSKKKKSDSPVAGGTRPRYVAGGPLPAPPHAPELADSRQRTGSARLRKFAPAGGERRCSWAMPHVASCYRPRPPARALPRLRCGAATSASGAESLSVESQGMPPPSRFGRRSFAAAALALGSAGCFGSFSAVRKLWAWNDDVGDKWVNWLVFVGLSFIPVYPLFGLADLLVLNSLEFWTGKNPVLATGGGRSLHRVALADPAWLRLELRGPSRPALVDPASGGRERGPGSALEFAALLHWTEGQELEIRSVAGSTLSRAAAGPQGAIDLFDGAGRCLACLAPAQVARVKGGAQQGEPMLALLRRELGAARFEWARGGHSPGGGSRTL